MAIPTISSFPDVGIPGTDTFNTDAVTYFNHQKSTFTPEINAAIAAINAGDFLTTPLAVASGGTGATTAADARDNLGFSDEAGEWQPTLTPTTSGSISVSGSFNDMQYTRIFDEVFFQGWIRVASVSSPVGSVQISLPYTTKNNLSRSALSICITNVVSANVADFVGYVEFNQAYAVIELGDGTGLQGDSAQQMQANTDIFISGKFMVD